MMIRSESPWRVRGYAPVNQGGRLLLETVHQTDVSKDIEVDVWKARRARGEVGRITVTNFDRGITTEE
jgi:hypothetical protein